MGTLPSVTFIKGQGGLGRPLPGQDFISGLVFYTSALPSGFTSTARMKQLLSLADAESAGILNDYSDATAATATYLISTAGSTGDIIEPKVAELGPDGVARTVSLGAYKKLSSDSTILLLGQSLAANINAGTITHGYSATFATATLTITAPKRLGIYLNSGSPLSMTITGTTAGTITQFSGGTFSKLALWHYHISEFFRIQPQGVLYVGFFAVPGGSYDFTEITTLQDYSNGTIRQIGLMKDSASAFSAANLTTIDAVVKDSDSRKKPLSCLYAADLSATSDISTLTDLSTLTANKVSAVIGQDGGGQGNYLFITSGKSVTCLGTCLGVVALAKVSESIAWVGNYNMSNGVECEVLAFANGQYFSAAAITDNVLETLNVRRYIFLKKFVGLSGSYFNDSHTAIIQSSDYAYIENNRTIDKATRLLYTAFLPRLNSPLQLNKTGGTLSDQTVADFESVGEVALDQMVRDGELSAKSVVINPAQNVLATSKIVVAVTLVINGVARYIEIPIGFKPSI